MAASMRETVSEPKQPFWKVMLYILAITIGISVLIELTYLLPQFYGGIASILILIFSTLLCSYIINRKIAKYTYVLTDNELVFYKKIGKREKQILNVKFQDIEWIKPVAMVNRQEKYKKTYGLSCRLRGEDIYTCQYKQNGKTRRFIFQPSKAFYRELMKKIAKKG